MKIVKRLEFQPPPKGDVLIDKRYSSDLINVSLCFDIPILSVPRKGEQLYVIAQ